METPQWKVLVPWAAGGSPGIAGAAAQAPESGEDEGAKGGGARAPVCCSSGCSGAGGRGLAAPEPLQ